MYSLYRIINNQSKSSYIGMTNKSISRRFYQHLYAAKTGKKTKLYDAIRSYGADCFSIILLKEFDTRQECCNAEIDLIAKEDFLYNLAAGGDGGFVIQDVESWKEKLREKRKGRTPALGMKHTDDNKKFFSECNKRKTLLYDYDLPSSFKEANQLYGISKTHYYRLVKRRKINDLS